MTDYQPRAARRWAAFLLLGICVSNSGCLLAAAGVAAGAGGYAYYKGEAKETFDGDFPQVWQATQAALQDLGLPVIMVSRNSHAGLIESETGTQERVRIKIVEEHSKIPTDPPRTTVGVRVATFGDETVSRRILQHIGNYLGGVALRATSKE